ncbi:MAG TPA: FAD:protein FMN transferase [Lachnospiraceae bacterium]|nr:FAD:protein FMN transferase [Lachnospiraceae bacterium]
MRLKKTSMFLKKCLSKKYLCVVLSIFFLFGCVGKNDQKTLNKYSAEYFDLFDTYSQFTALCASKEEFESLSERLHERLLTLNKEFDIYNEYEGMNNLKTVNDNAGIAPVKVSGDIMELVEFGKEAYTQTNGKINIALGNVLGIWHNYREDALNGVKTAVPTENELKEASKFCDIDSIIIDKSASTIYTDNCNTRIDVGAVAKGFAADKAKEFLENEGVGAALLNLGGNVIAINDENKPTWKIGIENPDLSQNYIDTFDTANSTVVTSGNYQRFYECDGQRYHHIIDPDTLYPADNNIAVTVKGSSSAVSDMLSTAIFILPRKEGEELARKYGYAVLWIEKNGAVVKTKDF